MASELRMAWLGEYYGDLLRIDAWVNNKSMAVQGNSLLCAKLQEREGKIRSRVRYLAEKRGVSEKAMWLQILKGEAQELTADEVALIEKLESPE